MSDSQRQPERTLALPAGDGVLNVNKPAGISSAKALHRVRRMTGVRRGGHAGTLDPTADGVLLICLGRSTKLVEQLMHLEKVYEAAARLDVTNTRYDAEQPFETVSVPAVPTPERVAEAARGFVGRIEQVPPAFSAVKVAGQPAYKYALNNRPPPLKPRPVVIYELVVTRYEWPDLSFTLRCGRGTYVRSLIRDWGRALGTGGCLTRLTRTRVGPFRVEDGLPLDDPDAARLANAFRTHEAVTSLLAGKTHG